jgi:hypothetical protein
MFDENIVFSKAENVTLIPIDQGYMDDLYKGVEVSENADHHRMQRVKLVTNQT